jgi:hypothetical protein
MTAIAVALVLFLAGSAVRAEQSDGLVPVCFVDDTVYYVLMDIEHEEFSLWYGAWELFTCAFTITDSPDGGAGFAGRWSGPGRSPWQAVKQRDVWSGRPAVSDTVIDVVSRVAKVDPELIKRVYPDRFHLSLTGNFQLIITTPDGAEQERSLAETWNTIAGKITSFGRVRELTMIVTQADAQSLYYALEPGTPVILAGGDR